MVERKSHVLGKSVRFVSGYGSMAEGAKERTLRGRVEPRSASEHRRLERFFRAAQEARNTLIEDSRSARAWNLRQIRKMRRTDPAWEPGSGDYFDWEGRDGPLETGKLARFAGRVVRNRSITRLRHTAVVCRLAWPRAAAMVGSGTPAATAAMPKPCRRLFGQAWGPSMPASVMILAIFRWAVARD